MDGASAWPTSEMWKRLPLRRLHTVPWREPNRVGPTLLDLPAPTRCHRHQGLYSGRTNGRVRSEIFPQTAGAVCNPTPLAAADRRRARGKQHASPKGEDAHIEVCAGIRKKQVAGRSGRRLRRAYTYQLQLTADPVALRNERCCGGTCAHASSACHAAEAIARESSNQRSVQHEPIDPITVILVRLKHAVPASRLGEYVCHTPIAYALRGNRC